MNYWVYPGLQHRTKMLALNASKSSQGDINGLLDCCSFVFNVTPQAMLGPSRVQHLAFARHAFVKICRDATQMSYAAISEYLGKRNHATAINSYVQAEALLETDKEFKRSFEQVLAMYLKARTVEHAALLQKII